MTLSIIVVILICQLLFLQDYAIVESGAVKERCRYGGCSNNAKGGSNSDEYNYGTIFNMKN